jgi:sigma-B regulation protein RsbQ
MTNVSSDTILKRHNVQVIGTGAQTMLFAHGLGCDQQIWRFITPDFEQEYRVVLFDYIGSGGSDWSAYDQEKYSTLAGYADDVVAICTALELHNVIYVGHSVSSMVGLLAAIANPHLFKCLIMVGPSPCYINEKDYKGGFYIEEIEALLNLMKKNYREWAAFFAPRAMGNLDRPELYRGLKERFCASDPAITLEFARVTFYSDNRNDLPKLKTPSLIMQIPDDIIVPPSVGPYMQQQMPGSTLAILKASGHFPHISAPQETIKVMQAYLADM